MTDYLALADKLRAALDADYPRKAINMDDVLAAEQALRAFAARISVAPANPSQAAEPVVWIEQGTLDDLRETGFLYNVELWGKPRADLVPIYPAPQAPAAQPLTESERNEGIFSAFNACQFRAACRALAAFAPKAPTDTTEPSIGFDDARQSYDGGQANAWVDGYESGWKARGRAHGFDSVAFLSSVEGDGKWADEFIAWYQPDKWLSEERACGAFLAGKVHAEPDMRHPKIQALIATKARYSIAMQLVEQILDEGPDTETTSMDMEHWGSVHDKLVEKLRAGEAATAAELVPTLAPEAVRAALELADRMCRESLPKFNWGASALDANAIDLLNRAPAAIEAARRAMSAQQEGGKP